MSDYDLYGCDLVEFEADKCLERPKDERTAQPGCVELDIHVSSLTNRKRVSTTDRHAKTEESQYPDVTISSLAELRMVDSIERQKVGEAEWHALNMQPKHQNLSRDWPWEASQQHSVGLNELIAANGAVATDGNCSWIDSLPSVAELVESSTDIQFIQPKNCEVSSPYSSDDFDTTIADVLPTTTSVGKISSGNSVITLLQQIEDPPDINRSVDESMVFWSQFTPSQNGPYGAYFTANTSLQFQHESPSAKEVENTVGIAQVVEPYYSDPTDTSVFPFVYAGKQYHIKTLEPKDLPPFDIQADSSFPSMHSWVVYEGDLESGEGGFRLEFGEPSPGTKDVAEWLGDNGKNPLISYSYVSENNSELPSLESQEVKQVDMSVFTLEVHASTLNGSVPNFVNDPAVAIFWQFNDYVSNQLSGLIAVETRGKPLPGENLKLVKTESELIECFLNLVLRFNPDILCGYELDTGSWGYLKARYAVLYNDESLFRRLDRCKSLPDNKDTVAGRHMINLWNVLRRDTDFSNYSFEYVVLKAFHQRTPHYSYKDLNEWWNGDSRALNSVFHYYVTRVNLTARLLSHFEIINRTCEKSRIIGIDFMSSLTRGSQFQVESILCKLSKRENFLLISPGKDQVNQQNALEHIPLVMEPKSAFYTDPICVLDFRSLYPSIIIALNLCYSTCIGKVGSAFIDHNRIGVKEHFRLQGNVLPGIGSENIYVAPNGMAYVSPNIRKSLLAQMLCEILDTRFMINDTRKRCGANWGPRKQKEMNNKQLALKFIANVTYGYTSASFSGRMPCAELADSIVLAGREILQWCIKKVESTTKWEIVPEVVYGDTDSLFVKLPGTTKSQAFRIGSEIADMITSATPDPILLKLEKVYSPSIMLTKKRYVGLSYDSPSSEAFFDAKGTETIRRDGTPIVQKVEKKALQILFDTKDLSKVKAYLHQAWMRIINGKVGLRDFCFSREVKLGSYKAENDISHLPGGAVVSLKAIKSGELAAPQYKERVLYVVTAGAQGSLISERVMSPQVFLRTPSAVLDFEYYIRKVIIPPLDRLFNLLGANVEDWYNKMPRVTRLDQSNYQSRMCVVCSEKSTASLCLECNANRPRSRYILSYRRHENEVLLASSSVTCRLCDGFVPSTGTHPCDSIECSVSQVGKTALRAIQGIEAVIDEF